MKAVYAVLVAMILFCLVGCNAGKLAELEAQLAETAESLEIREEQLLHALDREHTLKVATCMSHWQVRFAYALWVEENPQEADTITSLQMMCLNEVHPIDYIDQVVWSLVPERLQSMSDLGHEWKRRGTIAYFPITFTERHGHAAVVDWEPTLPALHEEEEEAGEAAE